MQSGDKGHQGFPVTLATWSKVEKLCRKLASKIQNSGFKPDIIIGVARGGLVPARILSDLLLVKEMASFQVKHYWLSAGKVRKARVTSELAVDIRKKKVLLVDDITDTGQSMKAAYIHVACKRPSELKTAVLEHKINSRFTPDFFAHKIIKWRWVTYPWARHEDITDLAARVRKPGMGKQEIASAVEKAFKIKISPEEFS